MFHTSYQHKIDIWNVNQEVAKAKEKHIKQYEKELSDYVDEVVRLSLYKIANNKDFDKLVTAASGPLSDTLGQKLVNYPKLDGLSLPSFFEGGKEEIVNLPKGFLYITVDKDNEIYTVSYHENTSATNSYLDMGRTVSSTLPTLLRAGTIIGTNSMMVSRIYSLIKILPFIK